MRLFSRGSAAAGELDTIQIDGTPNAPVINNVADVFGLTAYSAPPLADQPGTGTNLDSGGARTRSAITLIGGNYYGVHNVADPTSGNAALQWYKINADTILSCMTTPSPTTSIRPSRDSAQQENTPKFCSGQN